MTFAEVLPALEAGREAKWKMWTYRLDEGPNGFIQARGPSQPDWKVVSPSRNLLLASDWELVEEPRCARACYKSGCREGCQFVGGHVGPHQHDGHTWQEPSCCEHVATISRLERELSEAKTLYGVARSEQVRMLAQVAKLEAMERLLKQWGWEVK